MLKRDCNHFNIVISLAFLRLKFWFESEKAGFVSVGELYVNRGVLKVAKRGSFKIDPRRIDKQRNVVLCRKNRARLLKRDCNHFNIVISLAFLKLKFWYESDTAGFASAGVLKHNQGVLKVARRVSFKIDSGRRINRQRNAVICRKSAPNKAAPDTFEDGNAVRAASKTTWAEAWAICRKAGGRLLEHRTEPKQLRQVLEFSRGPKENYWVQSGLKPCSVTSDRHRSFVTESMGKIRDGQGSGWTVGGLILEIFMVGVPGQSHFTVGG